MIIVFGNTATGVFLTFTLSNKFLKAIQNMERVNLLFCSQIGQKLSPNDQF